MRTSNIKLITVLTLCASLVACSEPIPQSGWKQDGVDMTQVAGFQDCHMSVLRLKTGEHPLYVVRCPLSNTSTQQTVSSGKTTKSLNTTVIDGVDQTAAKIKSIEDSIASAQQELENLKAK